MRRLPTLLLVPLLTLPVLARTAQGQDAVVRIEERQFKAGSGRITFSEVPLGTVNPVYPPSRYGGGAASPTVRFGGHFLGRRFGSPAECPRNAPLTGCIAGVPAVPLMLDPRSPRVVTMDNRCDDSDCIRRRGAAAQASESLELGGTPAWNGPVAIWFDRDLAAVGLRGGWFDGVGGVAVTVYDRQGKVLGRTVNRSTGFEFMGLATNDLSPRIAGLEFHLVGNEPHGFGVDNIRFGAPAQIDLPGVVPPAPTPPPAPPAPRRPVILP